MSCPAEKAAPLAAMTTARTPLSSWMSCSAACSSAIRASDRLLRASGRLSVSTRMLPSVSRNRTGGCGVAARAVLIVIEISTKYPLGAFLHPNVTTGERRGQAERHDGSDMTIAKMSVAELETFLAREFPQSFGS